MAERPRAVVLAVVEGAAPPGVEVALFDAIHSVDRPSLCDALAKEIARQNRRPLLFVEVNTGEEPQKAGFRPEDAGVET